MSSHKFRNVFGTSLSTKFDSVKFDQSTTESCALKGNKKYTAFPWQSQGGGTVCVVKNSHGQKIEL